jgi:serine/threonine protein kinase
MVSSELGACEWFVWDIRRSGLIDRGQLDQLVGEFLKKTPRAEPPVLAEYLISQGILSTFQADRILQGKSQGLVLGPYVLSDSIGQGSMGQVYKALNKTDNQLYAVKVLPRRSMWNVRLARRQVRSFSQFTHPAVVAFVDVGTAGGQHYLVWPLVEGETLEAKVAREGKLTPDIAATIISQVAQGLSAAHQQDIFHGLLKPSNIMMGPDGQAKILDFGIGSLLAENEGESLVDTMSTANTLTSGLDCSSPESIMEPTNRTRAGDQYSLGCVLYFCLAGRYPFTDGTAVEKMMAHQFKQPTPIREVAPGIPDGLAEIVDRLLQKAPDARYPSVDDLVEAVQPYAIVPGRPGSRYGSQTGGRSVPGSSHGSRLPSAPAPVAPSRSSGSAQVPTPQTGPLTPVPGTPVPTSNAGQSRAGHSHSAPSHSGASHSGQSHSGQSSHVFGPEAESGGPRPARLPVPTGGVPQVNRKTLKRLPTAPSQSQVPTAVEPVVPVALPSMSDVAAPFAEPAGRVTRLDGSDRQGMGFIYKVFVFLVVVIGVYVIGKTFLFQS